MPRIYFTVSAKTIKREPPINRASPPHDYECLHLPRQKKKEGKLFSNGRRRKNLEILPKNRFGNLSNNFHAPACTLELRATRGIVHGGGDPRLVFYQGTLWYRRRFKGDSTMFTECRGPRRIEEECIEACMPLVGLSLQTPFLEPALLRCSTLLYIPFDEHSRYPASCRHLATCNATVHAISAFSFPLPPPPHL